MTMDGPRINNDERGLTINKTLFAALIVPIIVTIFHFGSVSTESAERISMLQIRQIEDRALITSNRVEINDMRRANERVDQRLLNIEQSQERQEEAMIEILRYLRNPDNREVPRP